MKSADLKSIEHIKEIDYHHDIQTQKLCQSQVCNNSIVNDFICKSHLREYNRKKLCAKLKLVSQSYMRSFFHYMKNFIFDDI